MMHLKYVYINVCGCKDDAQSLVPPPQQEHKEDGAEQNRECANSGNNNFSYHLHVAGQRVWNSQTHTCIHKHTDAQ